jgi:hypothetical protein
MQFLLLFLAFTFLHGIGAFLIGLWVLSFILPMLLNILEKLLDRSLTVRILKYELRLVFSQVFVCYCGFTFSGLYANGCDFAQHRPPGDYQTFFAGMGTGGRRRKQVEIESLYLLFRMMLGSYSVCCSALAFIMSVL